MSFVSYALRGRRVPVVWTLLFLGMAGLNAAILLHNPGSQASQTSGSTHAPPPAQINTPPGAATAADNPLPPHDSLPSQPLTLSATRLDLGDGKPKEIVRGELTLSNPGSSTTKFSLVKHCGCTELSPISGDLAPGATEAIRIGVRLADHANSEKNTSIEVQAGEPPRVIARCLLSARCTAPFSVTPSRIEFGSLTETEVAPAFRELMVEYAEGQPAFDPGAFVLDHAGDEFRIEGLRPTSHGAFIVRVSLKESAAQGDHYDSLELRPGGSDYIVRVPLHVTIVEPITVVPGTISLPAGRDQRALQSVPLLVMGRDRDEPLGDISLADGPPGVRVEDLGPVNETRRRVRVSIESDTAGWQKETHIWLHSGRTHRRFGFKFVKSS